MMRPGLIKQAALLAMTVTLILSTAVASSGAQGLFSQAENLVSSEAVASLTVFHPGSIGYIAVKVIVLDGWHINSNTPLDKFLIPSELVVHAPEGIELLGILYPEPELGQLQMSESKMSLYHGTILPGAIIRIDGDLPPGDYEITCVLKYQGCNDLTCLEPASSTSRIVIHVGELSETAEAAWPEIFSAPPFVGDDGLPVAIDADGTSTEGSFGDTIQEKGFLLTFILIFFGGLALNLTPCIYPLIPITVSYFGGQAGGKTSRTFLLTLIYVFGMSITYSVLGIIAAMTGALFGSALQNPFVIFFIVAVFVGLATSMFGLWEIRMPTFLARRTGTAKKGGWGAFFMGLTVGIVAAPCIGPFVLGLLTYVGEMGNPVMGFLMFFTLAWGMGIPFIILGTISGSISKLPSSGNWMIWVKKIFGFILLLMALYFARQLITSIIAGIGYVLILLIGGLFLGWIDKVPGMGRKFNIFRKVLGTSLIAAAVVMALVPGGPIRKGEEKPGIVWQPYTAELLSSSTGSGQPVMIDFSAEWCIPCHELDHLTFTDPAVIEMSGNFTRLKVDLTGSGDAEKAIKTEYGIRGVPTIVFFDRTGNEVRGTRITGFVGPKVLLEAMKKTTGTE
ncbi:MAG: thioredoxin family protein [Candidatus Krumholzibacteria bacterium]|nr:thioredoxin family protein [Candidatus Krumholzibacteria bacterium]